MAILPASSPRPSDQVSLVDLPGPMVKVQQLHHEFRLGSDSIVAIDDVSLQLTHGEFVSLIGPSGCGKSTVLRLIAGLAEPTAGRIEVGSPPLTQRLGATGYLPQRDMLMPWRTVLDNITLPLEYHGISRRDARREALELLRAFRLDRFAQARPAALSGGMRQRVALLRTVLTRRSILLLDEPFGALDALTRLEMQEWLLDLWQYVQATVLLVTHDLEEAVFLSDRVYVMSARPGRIAAEIAIPLLRPRPQTVIATPAFAALKGALLDAVRESRGTE